MTKQYVGKARDAIGLLREAYAALDSETNVTLRMDIEATIRAATEPTQVQSIKRYEPCANSGGQDCWATMEVDEKGAWVRYADVQRLLSSEPSVPDRSRCDEPEARDSILAGARHGIEPKHGPTCICAACEDKRARMTL